jgi:phage FluMu protein gp41
MGEKIEFEKGFDRNGSVVKSVTMREPTVEDQLTAQETAKSTARAEVMIIANLCECAPDEITSLSLRDYGKLQEAYAGFM